MSFLLAAQLVARGSSPSRCKAAARQLETNQAEYLTRSVRHLAARRDELLATLGLPPDATGIQEPDLAPFTRPLEEHGQEILLTADPGVLDGEAAGPGPVEGWRVYAVREGLDRYFFLGLLGVFVGGWIGALFSLWAPDLWLLPALACGALGGLGGVVLLGGERRYKCTDTECEARIFPCDEVCPGCGARIARRIDSRSEILADEE